VFDEASPSSHERFDQTRHFEVGFASTLVSIQCSSSSQSPMWMVCVTVSGYEYWGIAPSSRPGLVLAVDVLLDPATGAAEADRVLGIVVFGDEARLDAMKERAS
jgi:hypothetical protein